MRHRTFVLLFSVMLITAAFAGCSKPSTGVPHNADVQITVTDTRIMASQTTFAPGVLYHFSIANQGTHTHELTIQQTAMEQMPMGGTDEMATASDMAPGTTTTFDCTFTPAMTQQDLEFGCYFQGIRTCDCTSRSRKKCHSETSALPQPTFSGMGDAERRAERHSPTRAGHRLTRTTYQPVLRGAAPMTKQQHSDQRDAPSQRPSKRAAQHDVEHLLDRLRPEHVLPEETYAHLQRAGREQLLAVRSLIDALIDRLDVPEQRTRQAQREARPNRSAQARTRAAGVQEDDGQQQAAAPRGSTE